MTPRSSIRPLSAHALKVRRHQEAERLKRTLFLALCKQERIPEPTPEYQFAAPDRKFAFDFAWPQQRVAIEVQGGVWSRGAHSRGKGQLRDMEKNNLAVLRHWRVLYVVPDTLLTAETVDMLRLMLCPSLPGELPDRASPRPPRHA